jgi:predicted dehydrogenase
MTMPLAWGIIGAGHMAQAYVQAFATSRTARLVAIADMRSGSAARLAQQAGCAAYASYQALCQADTVDAVLVCTPPASHAEISRYFLQQGIPVLCEKPLSIDVASARSMFETAEAADVCLGMSAKYRYMTDVIEAKRLVAAGLLGDIVGCETTFVRRTDRAATWHVNVLISGGGVLSDHGPHAFDLLRYFLGPLETVYVVEDRRLQNLPVEETVYVKVRNGEGVVGRMTLSWNESPHTDDFLILYGTKGCLGIGRETSWYRLSDAGETVAYGIGYHEIEVLRRQIENMSAAIELREPLGITPVDALASVETIHAGYMALVQQTWVDIGESLVAGSRFA